jgi:hypothetical protein
MKKRALVCSIIAALLLSTSISPGIAQETYPPSTENGAEINLAAGSPWYKQYVDGAEENSAGAYPSIVLSPGGIPYVSYYNSQNGELWYARSVSAGTGNCGVGNNWNCQMVDSDGDVGKFSSIDYWKSSNIVGYWKLGISYYDTTNRALKLAIYSCTFGFPCVWNIYTIQQSTSIYRYYGQYSSIKFTSDGVADIAYHYEYTLGLDALMYAYPVSEGGNCGLGDVLGKWQCDSIDAEEGVGKYISLSMDYGDTAYIAYYDGGGGNLKYTYNAGIGGNCGPASEWLCTIIDGLGGPDMGLYASLVAPKFSGDKFRIAYHDKTNGHLKIAYTYAGTGNCIAVGWQCDRVDDTDTSIETMGISLATDESGNPIIAYMIASDYGPGTLHIAQSAFALGLDHGNCGDVPPGDSMQYWQCENIDSASGYTSVANFTTVAINRSGMAMIAYNERLTDYPGSDILKVAYQDFVKLYLPLIVRP